MESHASNENEHDNNDSNNTCIENKLIKITKKDVRVSCIRDVDQICNDTESIAVREEQKHMDNGDRDDQNNDKHGIGIQSTLIDPSLLLGLTAEEQREALAAAAAARRAEERVAERNRRRRLELLQKESSMNDNEVIAEVTTDVNTEATTEVDREQQEIALERRYRHQQNFIDTGENEERRLARQQQLLRLKESLKMQDEQQSHSINDTVTSPNEVGSGGVVFVPKKFRGRSNSRDFLENGKFTSSAISLAVSGSGGSEEDPQKQHRTSKKSSGGVLSTNSHNNLNETGSQSSLLTASEVRAIKQTYLGKTAEDESNPSVTRNGGKRASSSKTSSSGTGSKKITFKFRWDETDDTFDDDDPLYSSSIMVSAASKASSNGNRPVAGRYGNINNNDLTKVTFGTSINRYHHNTNQNSSNNRQYSYYSNHHQHQHHFSTNHHDIYSKTNPVTSIQNQSNVPGDGSSTIHTRKRKKIGASDWIMGGDNVSTMASVQTKPLHTMTARDWRIFRENYEIVVRGGQAPPPMRTFRESPLPGTIPPIHPALLQAIEQTFQFKEPSPIQRQAIPIGLQRRDLIGIAETGSGKTVAFGVPLCHYLLTLPQAILSTRNVAAQGPLALIMAPTRELALQIDVEIKKLLSCQNIVRTCPIVGGQPIQHQAQELRAGVHIVVGTPGRINDCIESAYLVLNQCCYIVMDEADRMIDMGFAPQMESILDAMGGTMKSENEQEAYQQELEDLKNNANHVARHRLTAMFSATMPTEVERIAKRYLRHPAIISVGDQDSGKNSRIVQKLVWVASPAKKEEALRNLLRDPRFLREKIIVFVNEKKHADAVGRMVERSGRSCVVLHGGKSQDQREENLEQFRRGGIVMVATDVAGRGLDIPDVAHVINYDLPTRSIENYTHRIGRTGRAGKNGYATSLISDEDEAIMAPLRAYLESTGNEVPERLARHSASSGGAMGGYNGNNNNSSSILY